MRVKMKTTSYDARLEIPLTIIRIVKAKVVHDQITSIRCMSMIPQL